MERLGEEQRTGGNHTSKHSIFWSIIFYLVWFPVAALVTPSESTSVTAGFLFTRVACRSHSLRSDEEEGSSEPTASE